jgi:ATP-binding cassette subfamily B protein
MFNQAKDSTKAETTSWRGLLSYVIEGHKGKFAFAVLLGLLSNGFISIANPLALKYLFDEGVIRGDFGLFVILGISFVVIFSFWRIWMYFYRTYVQKLKVSVNKRICLKMLHKYYELPYNEVLKKESGYFLSRIYDEVVSASQPTIDSFLSLSNTLVALVGGSIIVLSMSWRASLTITFAIPLIYLVSRKFGSKIKEQSKIEKEEEARLRGLLGRTINSYKPLRVFNLKTKVFEKIEDVFDKYAEAYTFRFRTGARYETISGTLMSYAETLAIIGAGYEMLVGRMSFGGYMAFMTAYWTVIGGVKSLFNLVPEMSRLSGSVERLKEFEAADPRQKNINYSNAVAFERINFAYNDEAAILQELDFRSGDGEKILVIGPNGSGKSTFAHLVAGLLSPSSGLLTTFPLAKVSAVIHPFDFIPGSVTDNLSFAASDAQKRKFAQLASEFGLDKHLEKDPAELSAGQRKKLEITMGLVKDSDIYIFDEPLAGVDVGSKETVINAIFEHTRDKILIVIMHGDEHFHDLFDRKIDLEAAQAESLRLSKNGKISPILEPEGEAAEIVCA